MPVEVRASGKMWKVVVNGTTVSNHRKKARAVEKAREIANERGLDTRAQRDDGTYQPWGDL